MTQDNGFKSVRTQTELAKAIADGYIPKCEGDGVFTAYGSSQVRACDCSQVTAYDSSQVRACDSSQVTAYDCSQVTASKYVPVSDHGPSTKVTGGILISIRRAQSRDAAGRLHGGARPRRLSAEGCARAPADRRLSQFREPFGPALRIRDKAIGEGMITLGYPRLAAISGGIKRLGKCACCETQAIALLTVQFSRIHGDGETYEICALHERLANTDVRALLQRVKIREEQR